MRCRQRGRVSYELESICVFTHVRLGVNIVKQKSIVQPSCFPGFFVLLRQVTALNPSGVWLASSCIASNRLVLYCTHVWSYPGSDINVVSLISHSHTRLFSSCALCNCQVMRVRHKLTGRVYAMKAVKLEDADNPQG